MLSAVKPAPKPIRSSPVTSSMVRKKSAGVGCLKAHLLGNYSLNVIKKFLPMMVSLKMFRPVATLSYVAPKLAMFSELVMMGSN